MAWRLDECMNQKAFEATGKKSIRRMRNEMSERQKKAWRNMCFRIESLGWFNHFAFLSRRIKLNDWWLQNSGLWQTARWRKRRSDGRRTPESFECRENAKRRRRNKNLFNYFLTFTVVFIIILYCALSSVSQNFFFHFKLNAWALWVLFSIFVSSSSNFCFRPVDFVQFYSFVLQWNHFFFLLLLLLLCCAF